MRNGAYSSPPFSGSPRAPRRAAGRAAVTRGDRSSGGRTKPGEQRDDGCRQHASRGRVATVAGPPRLCGAAHSPGLARRRPTCRRGGAVRQQDAPAPQSGAGADGSAWDRRGGRRPMSDLQAHRRQPPVTHHPGKMSVCEAHTVTADAQSPTRAGPCNPAACPLLPQHARLARKYKASTTRAGRGRRESLLPARLPREPQAAPPQLAGGGGAEPAVGLRPRARARAQGGALGGGGAWNAALWSAPRFDRITDQAWSRYSVA